MSMNIAQLVNHYGAEGLSVGERLSLFMSEINTSLTAFNVKKFNTSTHVVPYGNTFKRLKDKNIYIDLSHDFIASPLFFNPQKMSFRDYIKTCINVTGMFDITTDAVIELYKVIKTVTATNNVPFKLRESDYETFIGDLSIKLDALFENTGKGTRQLTDLYSSFTDAEDIFNLYNNSIKNISTRTPELLVKQVGDLTELVKLFKDKIAIADVILEKEDLLTLEIALKRVDNMVNYCGKLLSLCNELTRVFEIQLDYFKQK